MKFALVVFLTLSLSSASLNVWAQSPKPLTELVPTASNYNFHVIESSFDLGGRVMHFGLRVNNSKDESYSVYDLGGKYTRFETWVGIPGDYPGANNRSYSIRLDGKKVVSNDDDLMKSFDAPKHITVDVTGVQSLRLYGNYAIYYGEPVLYRGTPASACVASLVAPRDGVTVSASSTILLWEPVSGATRYGVEIVCTKGSSPCIYALNATDSTTKFDLTGVANGEYQWSVIAFNSKGVMGKFSKDRTFVVAR